MKAGFIGAITGAAITMGVVMGAAALRCRSATGTPHPISRADPRKTGPAAPCGHEAQLAQMSKKISSLESQLAETQGTSKSPSPAGSGPKIVSSPQGPEPGSPGEEFRRYAYRFRTPEGVADGLGLDAARRATFLDIHAQWVERLKKIESQRAKIIPQGSTTRIEIPAFAEEGKALVTEFSGRFRDLLSPREQENLNSIDLIGAMFGTPSWEYNQFITIERAGDKVTVRETGVRPGGGGNYSRSRTGAATEAKVLGPCQHLLK